MGLLRYSGKEKPLSRFGFDDPLKLAERKIGGIGRSYEITWRCNKMKKTIRQSAKAYEPKTTKSIVELKSVSTELEVEEKTFTDKDGKEFTINVVEISGEEYRVPTSVIKQLKVLLVEKPAMTEFKVIKSGEGLNTTYTVIPLE